jgi:hypothetical protein
VINKDCWCSRRVWTSFLVSSSALMQSADAGTSSERNFTCTCGLIPIRSSWGERRVMSCLQELCAYSAIGSIFAQLFCHPVIHARRYCSTHAFIHSVCQSVWGWNAVDKLWLTPRLLQRVFEKCDVKRGSRSEMIRFGIPNQGTRCFRYSWATPVPSIIL